MDDYERLKRTILLTTKLNKDKLRFIPAMDFHKACLQDEKDEEIIKVDKKAIYCCIIGLIAGLISNKEVKKGAGMNKVVDTFLSQKGNVSLDDTDLDKLLN